MKTTAFNILHNEKDPVFCTWFHILKHAPTKTWEQPVLTFIDNVKEKLPNNKIGLSNENIERCNNFMRNIARYIYAKSLADEPKDKSSIKQEMLQATTIAKEGKMYTPNIKITKHFRLSKQFEQKLNGDIPKQLRWGLCAIVEFSRNFNKFVERETKLKLKKSILENTVVGQCFPNIWSPDFPNNINKWTTKKIKKSLQTIGNLMLIEQDIYKNTHKIWKGNFFAKCKNIEIGKNYKNSIFSELALFCVLHDDMEWVYELWKHRQKYSVERLTEFFSGLSECILR